MKTRSTLSLLAAAAALTGFVVWEKDMPGTREAGERANYVLALDRDDIDGIVVSSNDERVELRRTGQSWNLLTPVKDRADQSVVNEILTRCEILRKEAVIEEETLDARKLADFGVAQPGLRLKLTGRKAPPELWIGKDTAVEGKIYVRLENRGPVFVTGDEIRKIVVRKADDFRDRRLTEADAAHTTRFSVKTAAGEIEVSKTADHWGLERPLKARADDRRVSDFIDAMLGLQIVAFAPDKGVNLNAYGLGEPRASLTFHTSNDEKPLVLELGAADEKTGNLYGRLSGREAVYLLPKRLARLFTLTPNDLRDRHLLRVDMDIVDRLTLEAAGKPKLVFQRQQEQWIRRDGARTEPVNPVKMLALVKALQTREIGAFVTDVASDLPKYGLDHPRLHVTFSSFSSENTAETVAGEHPFLSVDFGADGPDGVYARVEDEPFIIAVPRTLLDEIDSDPVRWRPLPVFNLKPEQIVALEITPGVSGSAAASPAPAFVCSGSSWAAAPGRAGTAETTHVQSLINTLASLSAMRWEASGALPGPVDTRISFQTADGKKQGLLLGARTKDGNRAAMIEGDTGWFTISTPDESAFRLRLTR